MRFSVHSVVVVVFLARDALGAETVVRVQSPPGTECFYAFAQPEKFANLSVKICKICKTKIVGRLGGTWPCPLDPPICPEDLYIQT